MPNFQIIANGISLDVGIDAKLVTEFVSTAFNDAAVLNGSYSYPISFPLTTKNIAFFEHSHHLENRAARRSREVTIVLFGMSWKNAKLTYSIKGNSYEGVLTVDNGAVATSMRDIKLGEVFTSNNDGKITFKSLSLGNTTADVTDHMLLGNTPSNNNGYCWPVVVNPLITGEEPEGTDVLLANEHTIINDFNGMRSVGAEKLYCPMFYLKYIVEEISKWLGYKVEGDFWEDEFTKSLILYNNGLRTGADWLEQKKINIAQHLPDMTVSELFKGLRNDFRVFIYFDSMTGIVHFQKSARLLGVNERINLSKNMHYSSLEIQPLPESAFKLITKIDDSDELYNSVLYEKSIMLGYDLKTWKEIPMTFGKVFMQTSTYKTVPNITTAYVRQVCNVYSKSYSENETVYNSGNVYNMNSFAPRLLSYKGVVRFTTDGIRIPFATSEKDGPQGIKYTSTLEQGGSGGILNNYSLPFYRYFCLSEKVDFKTELTVSQFFNITPLNKILISDINQAGTEALLDKVVFEPRLVGNGITAKITCYPNYTGSGDVQNMKIIVGSAVIENENSTVYAKLFAKVLRTDVVSNGWKRYSDVWIEFYSDQNGGIPRSVTNLEMILKIVRTDYGNFNIVKSIVEEPIMANGIRLELGERLSAEMSTGNNRVWDLIQFFLKNKEVQPTVIGNYEKVNPNYDWKKIEDIF